MCRAAYFIVEEVGQAGNTKACLIKCVDVFQLAFNWLQAFGGENACDTLRVFLPGADKVDEVAAGFDQYQAAVAIGAGLIELVRLVERALQQAAPGCLGPALSHGQQGDVVGLAAIAFIVDAARRLGHGGEHLQANAAFEHARQVGVAKVVALEQVALPQQHVVMQVGDKQLLMQLIGRFTGGVRRGGFDAVHLAVKQGGQGKHTARSDQQDYQQGDQNFAHVRCHPGVVVMRSTLARVGQKCDGWLAGRLGGVNAQQIAKG